MKGFCDDSLELDNALVLGHQSNRLNSCIAPGTQSSQKILLRCTWKNNESDQAQVEAAKWLGEEVATMVADFDKIEISYFLIEKFLGKFDLSKCKEMLLEGNELNLSKFRKNLSSSCHCSWMFSDTDSPKKRFRTCGRLSTN